MIISLRHTSTWFVRSACLRRSEIEMSSSRYYVMLMNFWSREECLRTRTTSSLATRRPALLLDCQKHAGFNVFLSDREAKILSAPQDYVPWNKVLLENCTQAMICYNIGDT